MLKGPFGGLLHERPPHKKIGARRVVSDWRLFSLSVARPFSRRRPPLPRRVILASTIRRILNQRGARFAALPDSRAWGLTAGVAVAPAGTIRAYDRCGANSCAGSSLDPSIAFAPDGKVLRHFGGGLLQMPHGLTVDATGNVWVTEQCGQGRWPKSAQRISRSTSGSSNWSG